MTEEALRELVREAIARYGTGASEERQAAAHLSRPVVFRQHASHALVAVPGGAETSGACLVEPAVACSHCGYCKSYGY